MILTIHGGFSAADTNLDTVQFPVDVHVRNEGPHPTALPNLRQMIPGTLDPEKQPRGARGRYQNAATLLGDLDNLAQLAGLRGAGYTVAIGEALPAVQEQQPAAAPADTPAATKPQRRSKEE